MRTYSKVERFLWRDPRFRRLSDDAQKLWLYFLSCPNSTTCPGLFVAAPMVIIDDLCWADANASNFVEQIPVAIQRMSCATEALCANRWMEYDATTRVVHIIRALEHNMPESPNVVRSWAASLRSIPDCAVRRRWVQSAYATLAASPHPSLMQAMLEALAKAAITLGDNGEQSQPKSLESLSEAITEEQKPSVLKPFESLSKDMPEAFTKPSESLCETLAEAVPQPFANQEQEQEQKKELASAEAECESTSLLRHAAPEEEAASAKKATAYHELAEPLARFLEQRIIAEKPDTRRPTEAAFNGWVRDMHRLLAIDNRLPERVRDIIDWSTRDDFWAANVRSPAKLRAQFDRLEVELSRRGRREASMTPRQRDEVNPDRALGCYQDIDEKMRRAGIDLGGDR